MRSHIYSIYSEECIYIYYGYSFVELGTYNMLQGDIHKYVDSKTNSVKNSYNYSGGMHIYSWYIYFPGTRYHNSIYYIGIAVLVPPSTRI